MTAIFVSINNRQRVKLFKRTFLAFFLLLLFSAYQVGITTFTHVYYINGAPVAHSHPFKKGNCHSESCLSFIALATTTNFFEAEQSNYQFSDFTKFTLILSNPCGLYQTSIYLQLPALRAPPVMLV